MCGPELAMLLGLDLLAKSSISASHKTATAVLRLPDESSGVGVECKMRPLQLWVGF